MALMAWAWSSQVPGEAVVALPAAARSLVLVVTPAGVGTGAVVGERGLVLAPWHVVRAHDHVALMPSRADGRGPDPRRAFAARVVGVNRTADLALLVPEKGGPRLPRLSLTVRPVRPGGRARVLAALSADWWQVPVRIVAHREGGSWHTGAGLVHSAGVVTARAEEALRADGGLLLDEGGAVLGLVSRATPGRLVTAVTVGEVLEFIRVAGAPGAP